MVKLADSSGERNLLTGPRPGLDRPEGTGDKEVVNGTLCHS